MLRSLWIALIAIAVVGVLSLSLPAQAGPPQNKGPKHRGAISGVVVDSSGNPVGGASVLLFDGIAIDQIDEDFTDSNGAFDFTRLTPGDYSLTAVAFCCGFGNASVTVTGGQTTSVTITLN